MKASHCLTIAVTLACAFSMAGAADTQPARPRADATGNDKRPSAAQLERRQAAADLRAANQERRQEAVDRREAHQQHRIEQGVKQGQLTPAEVATLQQQEQSIQTLETSFKSDGKLTHDEAKQLQKALHDASIQIWAQRHDTEGNQKSVSRLGQDILANDDLTAKIESGDFTHAQARAFLEDFRKMTNIKRRLASDTLTVEQRAKLQTEYNALLNQYFHAK